MGIDSGDSREIANISSQLHLKNAEAAFIRQRQEKEVPLDGRDKERGTRP